MTTGSTEAPAARKPRVVALGEPKFIGGEYLASFRAEFDFSVLEAYDRAATQRMLPLDVAKNGPVDAFIIRMGTPPYEPFDKDLLGALAPGCKVVASASAGFNEFDVDWMASEGMSFCNSVDAVAEATADMAIFLLLATLRNLSNAEKSLRTGGFRSAPGLIPGTDPAGLTLGIVGLGAIGKVRTDCGAASQSFVWAKLVNDKTCSTWPRRCSRST